MWPLVTPMVAQKIQYNTKKLSNVVNLLKMGSDVFLSMPAKEAL